jgi:tetratricopeptide (TPR) repeat protein
MQYGGGSEDYENFPMLDTEWDFISAALPRLLTGDNDRLQTICDQLMYFLNFTGRWDDILWISTEAETRALTVNDKDSAAWRAYQAGMTFAQRDQPAEVLACAARATEHLQDSTPHEKASAIYLRGIGHKLKEDYPAAIVAFREMLDIFRSISPESDEVTTSLNALASAEVANKDYPAAERDYREALRIAKIIINDEGTVIYTVNLAALALKRKQWVEAESLAREALALAEKVGRQELIAGNCDCLAEALLKQNGKSDWQSDLQEALSLSRRAVEIFTRLRHPNLQSAQETLGEIERAMQKSE